MIELFLPKYVKAKYFQSYSSVKNRQIVSGNTQETAVVFLFEVTFNIICILYIDLE